MQKRFAYPRFSKTEYERRYNNIRRMMHELSLDCLLIIGGSAAHGRLWFNFRYVTNMMGKAEMANYCFFPREGDPAVVTRPGHSLAGAMLARTAVRNLIVGKPSVVGAIVNEIKERGYDKGRVGIVEYDPYTSIPKNHWDFFASNLPKAEFVFVTKEFIAMRLLKSAEEIRALERSAEFGDIGLRSMQERVRPGMTEGEVFGIVHEAVLKAGGEMGMIQIASCSMLDPDINDQRPRPVERVIGERDIINNELGFFTTATKRSAGGLWLQKSRPRNTRICSRSQWQATGASCPRSTPAKAAKIPFKQCNLSATRIMNSTAVFSRACSAPIRATSRKLVSTGCRAPRIAFYSALMVAWFMKLDTYLRCKCTSLTRNTHAVFSSAIFLRSKKTDRAA